MDDSPSAKGDNLRRRAEEFLARCSRSVQDLDFGEVRKLTEELTVYQAELELQNEEMRETQGALRTARDHFAALFNHAPAGYIVLDASGIIRQHNVTWATMLNRDDEDFRGLPFTEAILPEDIPLFLARFRVFFRNPVEKHFIIRLWRKGASPLHARIEAGSGIPFQPARPSSENRPNELLVVVSDLTDLVTAQQQIEAQNRELQHTIEREARLNAVLKAIRNVGQLIIKENDPQRLISDICENLTANMGYGSAWIGLFGEGRSSVKVVAESGFADGFMEMRRRLENGRFPDCMQRALACGEIQVLRNPQTDCSDCPLSGEYGNCAVMNRRLYHEGAIFGLLAVSVPMVYADDERERALFGEMADDLAYALHKIEESKRLAESRAMLARTEEIAQIGSWEWDVEMDRVRWSDELFRLFQLSPTAEAPSYSEHHRLYVEEDLQLLRQAVERCLREGVPYELELRAIRSDGEIRHCIARGQLEVKRLAGPRRLVGSLQDITERKQIELKVANRERYLQAILQTTGDGFWVIGTEGTVIEINDAYLAMSGYSKDEFLGMGIGEIDVVETAGDTAARIHRIISKGAELFETRHRRKDGTEFPVEVSASWLDLDGGCIVCFCRDLTERTQREERLSLLGKMLDAAPAAITIHDTGGRFLYANRAAWTMHGYDDEEEYLKINLRQLDAPESAAVLDQRLALIEQEGEASFEVVHFRRDGSSFPLNVLTKIITWEGRPAVLSIATDISARKSSEEALSHFHELLRYVIEHANSAVAVHDRELRYIYVSQHYLNTYKVRMGDVIGRHHYEVFPDLPEKWREVHRQALAGKISRSDRDPYQRADGSLEWTRWECRPWYEADGNIAGIIVYTEVITEQVQAEEERERLQIQLVQAQKMESIGRLAGGVAHDFNNMLGVILGYTELLLDEFNSNLPVYSTLKGIEQAALRSADLTRQLLAFARKQTVSPKVLDLNDTVSGMLNMLRRLIGENIELRWLPGPEIAPVKIDPSQIDQILVNLCVNARDAITDTGMITIETAGLSIDTSYCAAHPDAVAGDYVVLSVSDTGCGMDDSILRHVFEPFFTTKEMNKGTGLGLAMVYGIVRQNNGFISIYSEPELGTTIKIHIPGYAARIDPGIQVETIRPSISGLETILLVEDEPMILEMAVTMLERMGYSVLPAAGPLQALETARAHQAAISLLMTDVIMPEMNGRELARTLAMLHPGLKCLFMSGYTANVIAHHGVLDPGMHFLQKPFSRKDLAAKVREVLVNGTATG